MAEQEKVKMSEMVGGVVELCPGLVIAAKPNLETLCRMEEAFGVNADEFETKLQDKLRSLRNQREMIILLAQQHDQSVTRDQVVAALNAVEWQDVSGTLNQAMEVNLKNSPAPGRKPRSK